MLKGNRPRFPLLRLIAVLALLAAAAGPVPAQGRPAVAPNAGAGFSVDGQVGLHSLIALSDGHLQKMADTLTILASTEAARSAEWERIRAPLEEVARLNVEGLNWFALPDGTYWNLDEGLAEGNLADREYFPRVLAGKAVLGDLVVSRATGRSVAIVAVPVYGADGEEVVGVLGASVYLDELSQRLEREMRLQPEQIFFSLDATALVGLHADPELIFLHPLEEEGEPELQRAVREMLSLEEGQVSYSFRDRRRMVLYRQSPVTGWWYGFGVIQ